MRAFAQVDVFTAVPGMGNPVAVVLDADGMSTGAMAQFAAWTNLSETTFVLPPTGDADYRVRIFTPSEELPFAGHPTIGTCQALLDAGRIKPEVNGLVRQECAAGMVQLTVHDDVLTFQAPRADVIGVVSGVAELTEALDGVVLHQPLLIDAGPRWLTARVDVTALHDLAPPAARLPALFSEHGWGLILYALTDAGLEVRAFFAVGGMLIEDPVCGSGHVAVGAHLRATGAATGLPSPLSSRQGRHRGRDGHVTVEIGESIRVGGRAVTVIRGTASV